MAWAIADGKRSRRLARSSRSSGHSPCLDRMLGGVGLGGDCKTSGATVIAGRWRGSSRGRRPRGGSPPLAIRRQPASTNVARTAPRHGVDRADLVGALAHLDADYSPSEPTATKRESSRAARGGGRTSGRRTPEVRPSGTRPLPSLLQKPTAAQLESYSPPWSDGAARRGTAGRRRGLGLQWCHDVLRAARRGDQGDSKSGLIPNGTWSVEHPVQLPMFDAGSPATSE